MNKALRQLVMAMVALAALVPSDLHACAVCFGDKSSQMGKAADAGVLTLLFIILAVLGGVVSFFIYIVRRTARLEQQNAAKTLSSSHQ